MIRRIGLIAAALLIAAMSHDAAAQGRTVLVLADHSDASSIPEKSPIFENAYKAIAEKLSRKGMTPRRPSDLPALRRLGDKATRDLATAVEAARGSGTRISAVLGLRIYVTMHRRSKGNSFQIWIDGEARDTAFGKAIAAHKFRSSQRHEVETSCGKDCMLEAAEEKVASAAAEFGETMAGKMASAIGR